MCLWKFLTIFPEANLSDQIHVEREDLAHSLHSNSPQRCSVRCYIIYNRQTDIYSMHLQKSQHQQQGFLCWFNYKCLYWQRALGFTVDRARHCMYFNYSFLINPAFQTWISCSFLFCKITFYLGLNWLHHHNTNK